MPLQLPKDGPVAEHIAQLANVPVDRIKKIIIVVEYDTGVAMIHNECCSDHARQFLGLIAATPPDVIGTDRFTGSN